MLDCFQGDSRNVQKIGTAGSKDPSVLGAGIVLKVMAGDVVSASVMGWYEQMQGNNAPETVDPLLAQLMNAMAGGIVGTGGKGGVFTTSESNVLANGLHSFLETQENYSTDAAYLNWLLLDEEQFKLVEGNYGDVPLYKVHNGNCEPAALLSSGEIAVKKNGYLYIYLSNTSTDYPVYFDDLRVEHVRGPLLEETQYYPFGLVQQGISSKALSFGGSENKQKFNGYEQQNKEFSDGSGLEWYDYKHRYYDNQIGRFFVQDRQAVNYPYYSPYQFAGNQVTVAIDLDGDEPKYMIDGNGHLTNPMKALLSSAFGYDMKAMNKTTWKPSDIQYADAITIFRTVHYNRYLSSESDMYWAKLIVHEQQHRDEIGNGVVGAVNWYLNYGVGYIGAGFNYEKNPFETRAYNTDGPMERLMNFGGGVALKVLQGNYSEQAQVETLNFVGAVFNLSEQTSTLNSMQNKLDNFTGSDKGKHRLEKKIERQQKRVDAASKKVQETITDNVVNTLNDVNKPKN